MTEFNYSSTNIISRPKSNSPNTYMSLLLWQCGGCNDLYDIGHDMVQWFDKLAVLFLPIFYFNFILFHFLY